MFFFFDYNFIFIFYGGVFFQSVQIGLVFGKNHTASRTVYRVGLFKLAFWANYHIRRWAKINGRARLECYKSSSYKGV